MGNKMLDTTLCHNTLQLMMQKQKVAYDHDGGNVLVNPRTI
jgi:hypothetical protein